MSLRKEYIIAYDIEDNKIRTNLYNQLLAYGLKSVQKSVFWGCITNAELGAVKPVLKVHHFISVSRSKTAPLFKPHLLSLLAVFQPSSFASTDNYRLV